MNKYILILIFIFTFSCLEKNNISSRLENFYDLLDQNQNKNFQNGQLGEVISYLEKKNSGIAFRKSRYEKLLQKEWIDFFDEEQTVEYFYILYQRGLEKK